MGIRDSDWLFYFIESIHVFGIVMLVGAAGLIDLRLLGVGILRDRPVSEVARRLLPWAWLGFGVLFATGALLFVSEAATKLYVSPSFYVKMALIPLAGLNAAVFQFTVYRRIAKWDSAPVTPTGAKVAAWLSLTLWAGIVFAGRGIAYY
jgi:hypothetical protein